LFEVLSLILIIPASCRIWANAVDKKGKKKKEGGESPRRVFSKAAISATEDRQVEGEGVQRTSSRGKERKKKRGRASPPSLCASASERRRAGRASTVEVSALGRPEKREEEEKKRKERGGTLVLVLCPQLGPTKRRCFYVP